MEPPAYTIVLRGDCAQDDKLLNELRKLPRSDFRKFNITKSYTKVSQDLLLLPSLENGRTGVKVTGELAHEAISMILNPAVKPVVMARMHAQLMEALGRRQLDAPARYRVQLKAPQDDTISEMCDRLPADLRRHVEVEYLHPLIRTQTPIIHDREEDTAAFGKGMAFKNILDILLYQGL